jgi:biotin-(acetyl-CoA carboxylase) ligase
VESRSVGDTPDTFIIGIGVNVNSTKFPAEIPDATSIAIETGKKINQSVIQRAVMNKLDELYTDLSWERIRDIYVKRSSLTGVRVIVKEQGKETSGICEHADPVDGILLRMESGYTQRIRPEWVEYIRPL